MWIEIKGLTELRQRLEQAKLAEIMERALAEHAQALADTVRERLSEPQGAGSHDAPWLRTGALRDSIGATTNGLEAAIGSNDPAAAPQEMGTSRIPPRPFLAPAAAEAGEAIAQAIGERVAATLNPGLSETSNVRSTYSARTGDGRTGGGNASLSGDGTIRTEA